MKKYKTSIEVKGENIKALFDCPVVTDIKKATDAVDEGLDVTDMLYGVTAINMAGAHKQVKRGSVLAQDVCGHWEIMTADEWEQHKGDTIEDAASDGDTTDTPTDGSGTSGDGGSSSEGDGGLLD